MKIQFLLKKKAKDDQFGLIYIALYLKDETELISTGQRISEKDWDTNNRFPKDHLGKISKSINATEEKVNKAINRLVAREEIVTPYSVKQEFNAYESTKLTQKIIEDKSAKADQKSIKFLGNHWMSNNLFRFAPSTQKAIKESIAQFLTFLTSAGHAKLERKELTPPIITAYERYLQEKKKLANSTHGKRMKHLRWFLKHIGYDIRDIKIRNHRKDIISLTQSELEALENYDVSESSEKQKVKDIFLLGCYTGQAINELKRINQTHIIDGKLCMTRRKTKRELIIPILPKTLAILQRYGMRAPKINTPAINREIKLICKDAGITQLISVRENKAGNDVEKKVSKHTQITTHIASKTFITLAPALYNLEPAEVAAIVGKDLKTLLNHYFVLPRESAIKKMLATKTV